MADDINKTRSWLSCEPLGFFGPESDGRLLGGSKPNFQPHPEGIAAATVGGLRDGTITDCRAEALLTIYDQENSSNRANNSGKSADAR